MQDVSVCVAEGLVVGILGPNGAGKTSLLKLLSGQLDAEGAVAWRGIPLSSLSIQELARQIAIVNQVNDTVFAITLQHVVRMGLLPHKSLLARQTPKDDELIAKAINAVGLSDKVQQEYSSLSGGEQQRALIARALVQQAPLLILDEPINHLDVYYQHQILQLLHELARELGITVVMSMHDLNLAASYCDQLCLLDKGRLVAQGKPEQVLQAELLSKVFKIACTVHQDESAAGIRVEFAPQTSPLLDLKGWQA